MYKVCLLEDQLNLNKILSDYLKKEGYEVDSYYDGESLVNALEINYHLFILDIMLPYISGYEVFKEIKKRYQNIPIIFISARDSDLDKIIGLEMGSDDYISKPFLPKELVIRVNNLIKRVYKGSEEEIIFYKDYKIDISKRIVSSNERPIDLTTLEFDLLNYLVTNKSNALSREQILTSVWGSDYFGNDRVVDDLMRRLRKKMKNLNIETIYGFGYRLIWRNLI